MSWWGSRSSDNSTVSPGCLSHLFEWGLLAEHDAPLVGHPTRIVFLDQLKVGFNRDKLPAGDPKGKLHGLQVPALGEQGGEIQDAPVLLPERDRRVGLKEQGARVRPTGGTLLCAAQT